MQSIWNTAKGIQRPAKGSQKHLSTEVQTRVSAFHITLKNNDRVIKKKKKEKKMGGGNAGRLQLKRNWGSLRQAWLDWSKRYAGGWRISEGLVVQQRAWVCICAWEDGWSPGQLWQPLRLHTCPGVGLPCCTSVVWGLVDEKKPGAAVAAGSLDPPLPRLSELLCLIPRSQTPAEAERSFYLPAAAASRSLLRDPSSAPPSLALVLLQSAFLLLLSLPSSLSRLLVSSFLCHKHTLDPEAFVNDGGGMTASSRGI